MMNKESIQQRLGEILHEPTVAFHPCVKIG